MNTKNDKLRDKIQELERKSDKSKESNLFFKRNFIKDY